MADNKRLPQEIEECLKQLDCTPQYDKRIDNDPTIPCVHKSGKQLIWFIYPDIENDSYRIRTPDISKKIEWYEEGSFRKQIPENISFEHKDKGRWVSSLEKRLSKDEVVTCLPIIINWMMENNFINMENKDSTSWVISCNPDYFDAISAFRDLNTVDWRQAEHVSFKTGDFVYLFVSRKVGTLKFKCVVKEIDIPYEKTIRDEKYILDKENLGTAKSYMRLEKLKEYNGCAFTKDYLSLFGFISPQGPVKLSSMGTQFASYLELIERLQAAKEIVPSEYDGSYELVTEVINSYSKMNDVSVCDFNDLNLVYLSTVGTWKHSIDKKKETVNKSHLPDNEKSRLNDLLDNIWNKAQNKEYKHTELNNNVSIGMFGTGFYNTRTKTDNESVQKFIKLCIDLSNIDDEEKAFTLVEDILKDGMNGLATGGISQVLHCLKPFIFPILNSNQGKNNLFSKLGIKIEKVGSEENYAANCRKIKEYRDSNFEWKNYRNFDIEDLNMTEVSKEYVNFKCMLEYFVSHLEYIQNEDTTYVGYEKYIKPYVDKNNFKMLGQGYKGQGIQSQVSQWEKYDCGNLFLNIANNYGD
jgi:hypothetical protein